MLPVSLYIEGLHSYANPVEIDFTKFYKNRLFGIFGDTGSGKSSILDAIILSIYGHSPRLGSQKRTEAINPLRDSIKIKFFFTVSGQKYLIERIIGRHNRVKLSLYQNGEFLPLAEKDKEFDGKIREIIGLSRDEFCKVVILPQNKFAEFLQQKPAERAEMIGNIFDINIFGEPLYSTVNNKLKEAETSKIEKEKRLNELQEVTENFIREKEDELLRKQDEFNRLSIKQKELNQKLELFKILIQTLNEKSSYEYNLRLIEQKRPLIEEKRKKLQLDEELSPYKTLYEEWKKLHDDILDNANQKQKIQKDLEKIACEIKELEKNKKEFDLFFDRKQEELHRVIERAERAIEIKGEIDIAEAELKDRVKNKFFEEEKLQEILLPILPELKELRSLKKEISKHNKDLIQKQTEYEKTFKNIEEIVSKYTFIKIDTEDVDEKIEEEIKRLRKEEEIKRGYLKELEIKNLASSLSRFLKPGQPCPVCGSLEHPRPFYDNVQEEIKAVESTIKRLSEDYGKLEEIKRKIKPELSKLIQTKTRIDECNKTLKEKNQAVLNLTAKISNKLPAEYSNKVEELLYFLSALDPEEVKNRAESELEDLKKHREKLEKDLNNKKRDFEQINLKLNEISTSLERDKKREKELFLKLDEKARQNNLTVQRLPELFIDENERKALREEIDQWAESLNKVKGALKSAEERLGSLPLKELPEDEPVKTKKELELINQNISRISEAIGSLKESIKRDKEALIEKKVLTEEIKNLNRTSAVLQGLKNILIGKQMVKFLSMYLFNDVVRLANKLLDDLIGKRFRLNISEDLAFSVKDLFYNKDRPVETLSGGETFIVSFALSLALSYYIQLRRKKSIQFFFIDEGFSSLDKDLLDSVCNIFHELRSQDRLVGIISHISELKQLIPEHIYVYRDSTGASRIR